MLLSLGAVKPGSFFPGCPIMLPSGAITGRRFSLQPGTGGTIKYGLEVWAYCLMTNHIHRITFPHHQDSPARTLAATQRRYSLLINRRIRRGGHLWQGRFFSCPLCPHYYQ
jgi:hypothetical protein